MTDQVSDVITLEDMRWLPALCGPHHAYFQRIEAETTARLDNSETGIAVKGDAEAVAWVVRTVADLQARLKLGQSLDMGDVEGALRVNRTGQHKGDQPMGKPSSEGTLTLPKRTITPRSPAQQRYIGHLRAHELVFGVGPAGTGKTYLAVAYAAMLFLRKEVDKIILSRPAVEAGERIGFLPGDMKEKVDPYLQPLYDALYDVMPAELVDKKMATGEIEIAPLAFMRGRTLTRAAIILDEAQNATIPQMKMFLTRLGEGSRMVVTGDPSQTDLPVSQTSGLKDALFLLQGMEEIGVTRFTAADVVRHPLVGKVVDAYDARDQRKQKEQEG